MNKNISQTLKGIIFHELSDFLLCGDKVPDEVVITVDYPTMRAKLKINVFDIAFSHISVLNNWEMDMKEYEEGKREFRI